MPSKIRIVGELNRKAIIKSLDKKWSEAVRGRGGCALCGKTTDLQAHHIRSRRSLGTRWLLTNGVCLCRHCHLFVIHRDTLAAADFYFEHIGRDQLNALRVLSGKPTHYSTAELKLLLDNWKN
ncbi:MAG: HNH endonuclease [Candidatus Margulisbacteria bacterium]|jgi:hypothetical protein|nr:HNH endonuclease [Candidatus Margulisiibacteriota bacterium]